MLVAISDLHFEEETRDVMGAPDDPNTVRLVRNLRPAAYQNFVATLAAQARRNRAKSVDLVLAGDVFDLHRTQMWFDDAQRPYVDSRLVTPALETKLLGILDAIAREKNVAPSLEVFQRLGRGKYLDAAEETDFPVPVTLHYVPGNHDRLANSTPTIRKRVRELLGLRAEDPASAFSHKLVFSDPAALVFHGHEYDRFNFSADLREPSHGRTPRPFRPPGDQDYDAATLGDFVTIEVALQLARLFRNRYGDNAILSDPAKRAVYLRLLEFDDLRPQSALLDFLLTMPERGVTPDDIWKCVEPIVHELIASVADHAFLRAQLEALDDKWTFDVVDAVQAVLSVQKHSPLSLAVPMWAVRSMARRIGEVDTPGAETYAAREPAFVSREVRFVVAGHTHSPQVALLSTDETGARCFVDTGTWRSCILCNRDRTAFGHLKSLTYLTLYGSDEDTDPGVPTVTSLDYWTGFTQRW